MTLTSPYQVIKQRRVKVLLVDDQPIISESVKRMLADHHDIEFVFCSDPTKAIDVANTFEPTVILQDLVMPEIDGMTLVRYFRANQKTKEVPLIVLSAKEEPTVKAEAFESGANDYLVKLPGKEELVARIRYHSKGYISLLERNEAFERLSESQRALQQELDEAAEYVRSLLPLPIEEGKITTDWTFIPSISLGGDAFGYHWIDRDHFAIYLLDVCGHGVKAALLSISVINVLRSESLSGADYLDPSSVLSSLNKAFPMEKNNHMFFTIWYGVYQPKRQTLTFSTGGHPPAFLIDRRKKIQSLNTGGVLIGGVEDAVYEQETLFVDNPARLLVFSDGVFEIKRADESHMSFREFEDFVRTQGPKSGNLVEKVLDHARSENGSGRFDDDFSIMQLNFSEEP